MSKLKIKETLDVALTEEDELELQKMDEVLLDQLYAWINRSKARQKKQMKDVSELI